MDKYEEQDRHLENMSGTLEKILNTSVDIGEELKIQNIKLDEIIVNTDKTADIMDNTNIKINEIQKNMLSSNLVLPGIVGVCLVPFFGFQISGAIFVGALLTKSL